jgi:anti-sigma B factor antagonist
VSSTEFGIAQRTPDERTAVISVEGEIDLATAPRLKWMLVDAIEARRNQLVVDLSAVSFVDSTALSVLVGVKRRLADEGRLAIVCARTTVLSIFEFSGMDGLFAIFQTLDEALAYAQGHIARAG